MIVQQLRSALSAVLMLALGGCATAAVVGAFTATDLSGLRPGMSGAETHKILGKPERTELISSGKVERFTYDRGIATKVEKRNVAIKAGAAAFMALVDMVSMGVIGWCAPTCQKGWLYLTYDGNGSLVSAREEIADTGGFWCWTGKSRNQCLSFANLPKPSTLPQSLRK